MLEQGTLKTYVKTGDSGNPRAQSFCGECGTPIHSSAVEDPPQYIVRLGSIDHRAELPALQIWQQSALKWSADLTQVPAKPREP